ncbi:MAG TPA: outer membrane protein assembly factor BamE [Casimicrobiaceae bacterium]|nr:outer membrane protein assembly factor BamE [Casimicrobiaceae bacterium]
MIPSRYGVPARLAWIAIAALCLSACATVDEKFPTLRSLGVYKIDINQGNYLSQDMVDKLKPGMTRAQVRTVLGTPLVTSVFRDNRWDYVYEFTRQGKVKEHRNFTVYFQDDKVARWEGDQMPESLVDLNRSAGDKALPKLPGEGKSWWEKLKDIFSREPS